MTGIHTQLEHPLGVLHLSGTYVWKRQARELDRKALLAKARELATD